MHRLSASFLFVCALFALVRPVLAQSDTGHRVLLQGNEKLAILAADGGIEWQMKWGGVHDLHRLPNGHILTLTGPSKVAEIDPVTSKIVWQYDSATANGNAGRPVEVHAIQPLAGDNVMIAESGPGRIIEVDRDGKLLHEIKLKVDHPNPHTDTRLVRKLANGHYLVCHEGDGAVREYDANGQVTWEFSVPLFSQEPKPGHGPEAFGNKCFAAVRLANGNTLITTGNGHGVLEVTPQMKIVWQLTQRELSGIVLAWVTTIEVLPGGNYVIGNCHAGPGQPLLVEFDPRTKKVVWKLDQYDTFGNNVSNSKLLDVASEVQR